MKNLTKAILGVMADVKGMEKNSKVGSGKMAYDGTKYSDVAEKFNDALVKHGLSILPIDIEESTQIDRWDALDWNGKPTQKQSVFTKVKVKYLLLHESGESQELMGYGHGVDPQDKGAGKATTYALKNCMLYTFLTPVGKMDDTDLTHSNDISVPKKPQPKQKPTPPKPPLKDMEFKQWCNQVEAGENPADLAISRKYTLSESQKAVMPLLIKIKNKSPKGIMASTDFSCLYDLAQKSDGYLKGVLDSL